MPPRRRSKPTPAICQHARLITTSSPTGIEAGCIQYTHQQLHTAATGKKKHSDEPCDINHEDFPAPLALPGDSILDDPKYPPQSFCSWLNLSGRNSITDQRNVLYVAAPPVVRKDMGFLEHKRDAHGTEVSLHRPYAWIHSRGSA